MNVQHPVAWEVVAPQLMGKSVRWRRREVRGSRHRLAGSTFFSLVTVVPLSACLDYGFNPTDFSAFEIESVLWYACGSWNPAEPSVDPGLFDVSWGLESAEDDGTGPKRKHRAAVLSAGGTIAYEFHLPMIRAVLSPGRVPEMQANWVRGVSAAAVLDVEVFVSYGREITTADILLFETFGGELRHEFRGINTLFGTLPDPAIPRLRRRPEVTRIDGNGILCLGR